MKSLHNKESLYYLGVKALFQNSKGEILLLQSSPRKDGAPLPIYWDFPGGRVEDGYSTEETLIREVSEEIGLKDIQIDGFFTATQSNFTLQVDNKPIGLILFIYFCSADTSKITLSEEHQDFGWFSLDKTDELLSIKYPSILVDQIRNLEHIS